MWPLSWMLTREGLETHCLAYSSRRKSIADCAQQVYEQLVERNLTEKHLHFVAHSMGCLVLRELATRYRLDTGKAIMLGPPNGGAEIARLALRLPVARHFFSWLFGPALEDIAHTQKPQNILPLEIHIITGGLGKHCGMTPFLSGDNDGMVTVEEAQLKQALSFEVLPVFHPLLLIAPSVLKRCRRLVHTDSHFSSELLVSQP